jgi:hypothetical protein
MCGNGGNVNWSPAEEVTSAIEGREKGDAQTAVGHCVQQTVGRRDHKQQKRKLPAVAFRRGPARSVAKRLKQNALCFIASSCALRSGPSTSLRAARKEKSHRRYRSGY